MKGGVGFHLKALAFVLVFTVLLLTAFTCTQQEKASAAANLTAYMSVVCPNWEPMGYNITGTAPWLDVQTLGWNAVKIGGNVGIGDGSYRTLKNTSTPDTKFADTGSEMMAADISMAPLDVRRMSGYSPADQCQAKPLTTYRLKTIPQLRILPAQAMLSIPAIDALNFDKNVSETPNNTSTSVAKEDNPGQPGSDRRHGTERSIPFDTDGTAGQRPDI